MGLMTKRDKSRRIDAMPERRAKAILKRIAHAVHDVEAFGTAGVRDRIETILEDAGLGLNE